MHSSFSGYLLVLLDEEFLITAKIVKHNPKVYLIWINATMVTVSIILATPCTDITLIKTFQMEIMRKILERLF